MTRLGGAYSWHGATAIPRVRAADAATAPPSVGAATSARRVSIGDPSRRADTAQAPVAGRTWVPVTAHRAIGLALIRRALSRVTGAVLRNVARSSRRPAYRCRRRELIRRALSRV